jgi:streptogramin lyase
MTGSPFAEASGNRIGRITPAGVITEFPIPTLASGPNQITAGPDGNLWFTETQAAKIGRITLAGAITEFPVPTTDSGPSSITAGPDGNVWFTERFGNRIGRITPGGVITEFLVVQAPGFFLGAITAGPDGALWFTEEGSVPTEDGFRVGMAGIGRITPDGAITGVPFRKTFAFFPELGAIPAGPDGNLWFTARMRTRHFSLFGGIIGRLTPSAPSPIPTLTLGLNQTRFTAGQILRLTATLTPGTDPPAPVDAYVVVQLPGGELLSLQPGGRVVPGVAPIARDFNPFAFNEQVLQVPFSGLEVPGPYQWFGALTEPGALNVIDLIGRVTQTPFTLGP